MGCVHVFEKHPDSGTLSVEICEVLEVLCNFYLIFSPIYLIGSPTVYILLPQIGTVSTLDCKSGSELAQTCWGSTQLILIKAS